MPSDKALRRQSALEEIKSGVSVRDVALKYGVTQTTLYNHMHRHNIVIPRPPLGQLTAREEDRLGNWLVYCYYMGYFQNSQSNLNKEATTLARRGVSKRRFDNEWCKTFPQRIPYVKQCLDAYDKYKEVFNGCGSNWLGTLLTYCRNEDLLHCFEEPRCMYYFLMLDMADNLKAIIAYTARGDTTPPLIVNCNMSKSDDFEDLTLPQGWIKYNCQETITARNQDIALIYYLEQVLRPYLVQEKIEKPILLFHKYLFNPISLAFYEICTDNRMYPVNCHQQLAAVKLHQSLQMEISFRMKSSQEKEMSSYVELMREILEVKLTKERMCESFRDSDVYPLNLGKLKIEQLPAMQMKAEPCIEEPLDDTIEIYIDDDDDDDEDEDDYASLSKKSELSTTAAQKRKPSETISKPNSGILHIVTKKRQRIAPPPKRHPKTMVRAAETKVAARSTVDIEDVIIEGSSNQQTHSEDPLYEAEVEVLYETYQID